MSKINLNKLIEDIDNEQKLEDFIKKVGKLDNKNYNKMRNSAFLRGYTPHLVLPSVSYLSTAIAFCVNSGDLELIDAIGKTIYVGTILNVVGYIMGAPLVPMLHIDISNYGAKYRQFYKIIKRARKGFELGNKLEEDYFRCRNDDNLFHMSLIGGGG